MSEREPTRKDRAIAKVAAFLARAVYRDIEVHTTEPDQADTPQVTVANHFGGLSDALVLLHTLPRRPSVVARDVIWKVPLVGRLLTWVGGIPVHKPEDSAAPSSNDQMFASCYGALEDGGHILIFPEGVTRNEPSIAPVKTGAARIALGARAHGACNVTIVPVGLHYEDKAALRSRVFVNVGGPIQVDRFVHEHGNGGRAVDADDREAVRDLTDELEEGLRRVAPDFEDWDEARQLTTGADVALRSQLDDPAGEVPFTLRDRLANTLSDRPEEQRRRIREAVSSYRRDLEALGLTDAELHARLGTGALLRSLLGQLVVGLFLVPFALVGAAINVVPFLVVKAVGLLRVAPSMHATIKPAVAVLAFGVTWVLVIWRSITAFGWEAGVVAFVLLPVYFAAVILLVDRAALAWQLVRRWRATAGAGDLREHIAVQRRAVVETVLHA